MPERQLLGVILAGGRGARMEPFSAVHPKPLLPVLDRPIIEHQIAHMTALGVREIVVVVGHLGSAIAGALGDGRALGVEITYVEQREPLGIAHALREAERHVKDRFLLTLGDIFFVPRDLGAMVRAQSEQGLSGVLAVKEEHDVAAIQRNFTVVRASDGTVRRVIEKPSHPTTALKGCGIYLFDPAIFDAVRRTPRSALRDEYELTDAIQIFIDDGHRVGTATVIEWDVNLTVPRDLLAVNRRELERRGLASFVGEGADVSRAETIERTVVGRDATVAPGVRVVDSVVFSGTRVEKDAVRSIVTQDVWIDLGEDG